MLRAATACSLAMLTGCATPASDELGDPHAYAALVGRVARSSDTLRIFDDAARRLGPEFEFWYDSQRHRYSMFTNDLGVQGFEFATKKRNTPVRDAHRALREAADAVWTP